MKTSGHFRQLQKASAVKMSASQPKSIQAESEKRRDPAAAFEVRDIDYHDLKLKITQKHEDTKKAGIK
jgi:hypothetical protein